MVREKDVCWEYAEKLDGNKVKCKFCQRVLNGGISRLKHHLSRFPSKGVNPCSKVRDDVTDRVRNIIASKEEVKETSSVKKQKVSEVISPGSHSATKALISLDTTLPIGKMFPSSNPMTPSSTNNQENAERNIALFFFENKLDFSVARSSSYQLMIDAITKCGPGFTGPSAEILKTIWLERIKSEVGLQSKDVEKEWATTGCTIIADTWTDYKSKAIINFLVSSPSRIFFHKSVDASAYFKNTKWLADLFDSVIQEFGPENVVQIIMDSSFNYTGIGNHIVQNYGTIFVSPCASQCLNLILEEFTKIDWISRCILQAQTISKLIYNNASLLDLMKSYSGGQELIRTGATKSVSTFLSLQTMLKLRTRLKHMFHSPEYALDTSYANKPQSLSCIAIAEDGDFWRTVEECVAISEPFLKVLREVSEGKPTVGSIYELMTRAKESIRTYYIMDENKCKTFLDIVDKKWRDQLHSPLHAAAAFLNPSIQYNPEIKFLSSIKEDFYHVLEKLLPVPDMRRDITNQIYTFTTFFSHSQIFFQTNLKMGVISRKIFPACESMCVCCPALRSRSRQPVKRYRKLLADIFPKSPDELPNERKIVKLCEYAAKNPFRIPKIAKYLEERCYKELRSEHIKLVKIIAESFNKLLSICKAQITYFAVDVLKVTSELLDYSKDEAIQALGCQSLTRFIYCQVDSTYTHNIEKLVRKVCMLSQEPGETHENRCLRASSLQCLSAMVWFMTEFSHIFADFDEIVYATLDNYDWSRQSDDADIRTEAHHNWVNEVVRSESRAGSVVGYDNRSSCLIIQPRPEVKDPSLLTREEIEKPEIWAQICIQRLVELAKESTTMRRVLDPMFVYFDTRQHWAPQNGLAMVVLSRMAYFIENTGNQRFILASVIHHLDHKNVMNDPQLKSYVVQVATSLAMQIRSGRRLAEIGFVGDLCRHLRKSFQASSEFVGEQEFNLNISLQSSIENCLLEIANGVIDVQPLFDLMAITLENIPSGVVGRATIGSLIVLARALTSALANLRVQQGFPESLLMQLLKVMMHTDVEARIGAHLIFSVLLLPSSFHTNEVSSLRSRYMDQRNKRNSQTATASASITALLEKLRRGRDGTSAADHGNVVHDDKERDTVTEEWKQGCGLKTSPNFYKLSSIIDRATGSQSLTDVEPYVMKLSEDQMGQLLSAFWIQANLPDNLPSNIEAIAHSFILALIVLRIKNLKDRDNLVIRFFQLPLSLWTMLLDPSNGTLPPACQRSIFVLSVGMLVFACKIYQIHDLNDVLTLLAKSEVDPFLGISDDNQVYAKINVDLREYGTASDNQLAMSTLSELRNKISEYHQTIMNALIHNLTNFTELDADNLTVLLSETFKPDEDFVFGPQSILDQNQMTYYSQESLSVDEDFPSNSGGEDDNISEASVSDLSRFIPKMPVSPPQPHVISIGQLMESALEVASHVAGTSVSTSPLPYNAMASQCESLGTCSRKKLSNWLAFENHYTQSPDKSFLAFARNSNAALEKEAYEDGNPQVAALPRDPMKLPPASPFDNFLKAAGC